MRNVHNVHDVLKAHADSRPGAVFSHQFDHEVLVAILP
jgi:hypothetical protein